MSGSQLASTASLFTRQTAAYAAARPHYPGALYDMLVAHAPGSSLAWDCGCGSGQATGALAARFERVLATDVSVEQLAVASPHHRVRYVEGQAESMPTLATSSVDLVTVATAVHWFDIPRFYAEAARALRPGGLLAMWAYASHEISPEVDAWTQIYARDVVGEYWQGVSQSLLRERYTTLPTPPVEVWEDVASELPQVSWAATAHMTLSRYADYLRSWSASQAYRDARGVDPLTMHLPALRTLWGDGDRLVSWPLFMRVFRKM